MWSVIKYLDKNKMKFAVSKAKKSEEKEENVGGDDDDYTSDRK